MSVKDEIGSARDIKEWRKAARLSQEELARMARVSVFSLSRWERGAVEPSRLVLRGLQGILEDYKKDNEE